MEERIGGKAMPKLLGGTEAMIESPLLQKMRAQTLHEAMLEFLKGRFGTVPRDVSRLILATLDEKKLKKLTALAGKCPDMEAFREALLN